MHAAPHHNIDFPAEAAARQCWLKTPLGTTDTAEYFFAPTRGVELTGGSGFFGMLGSHDAGTTIYLTNGNPPELQHVCARQGSFSRFTLHHNQHTATQLLSKFASNPQVAVIELIKQQPIAGAQERGLPTQAAYQRFAGAWDGRIFTQPEVSATDRASLVWAAVVECSQDPSPLSDYSSSEEHACSSECSSEGEDEPSPPVSPPASPTALPLSSLSMVEVTTVVPPPGQKPAAARLRPQTASLRPEVEQICALTKQWVKVKQKARSAARPAQASQYAAADQLRNQMVKLGVELERWEKEWLWHKRGFVGIVGGAVFETNSQGRICKGLATDAQLESIILERQHARSAFDFQRADELRGHLKQLGVSVDDERGRLNGRWSCLDGRSGDFVAC